MGSIHPKGKKDKSSVDRSTRRRDTTNNGAIPSTSTDNGHGRRGSDTRTRHTEHHNTISDDALSANSHQEALSDDSEENSFLVEYVEEEYIFSIDPEDGNPFTSRSDRDMLSMIESELDGERDDHHIQPHDGVNPDALFVEHTRLAMAMSKADTTGHSTELDPTSGEGFSSSDSLDPSLLSALQQLDSNNSVTTSRINTQDTNDGEVTEEQEENDESDNAEFTWQNNDDEEEQDDEEEEDGEEEQSDIDLLLELMSSEKINTEDVYTMDDVNRDSVFSSAVKALQDPAFSAASQLKVQFQNSWDDTDDGDDDMDDTEAKARFFQLLMLEIQNSAIFEGADNEKYLAWDSEADTAGWYELTGQMIALSILHCHLFPDFFGRLLWDAILYGPDSVELTIEDIIDSDVKRHLREIELCDDIDDLREAVSNAHDVLDQAGCVREIQELTDKDQLIKDAIQWYVFGKLQGALDKFLSGLQTLGMLETIRENTELFQGMFYDNTKQQEWTINGILQNLLEQVAWDGNVIDIDRNNILQSAITGFKSDNFIPNGDIKVHFIDSEGNREEGIDCGGPKREFFMLLMRSLRDSVIFEGPEDAKLLSWDSRADRENLYEIGGQMIALSLIHGGPAPHFFSRQLCHAILYGPDSVELTLDDILDPDVKTQLQEIQDCNTVPDVRDAVTKAQDFISMAGCLRYVQKLEDRDQLVKDAIHWYVFGRPNKALQKFLEGLKTLELLNAMQENPKLFEDLLCSGSNNPLTAMQICDLFSIYLPNTGDDEEEAALDTVDENSDYSVKQRRTAQNWKTFVNETEAGKTGVTLADILAFATGGAEVPPLGFPTSPCIGFLGEDDVFPQAATCSNCLSLPLLTNYETFAKNMSFGIKNSPGFGQS